MATISQTISRSETDFSRQAYQILHFAFTVAPVLFGLDTFFKSDDELGPIPGPVDRPFCG
jgi:hypothetical protein